jgi:hypothetical protein
LEAGNVIPFLLSITYTVKGRFLHMLGKKVGNYPLFFWAIQTGFFSRMRLKIFHEMDTKDNEHPDNL